MTANENAPESFSTTTSSTSNLPPKVWTTLITNTVYLSGLLTLEYSLRRVGSKYPLVALYTETFPEEGLQALKTRGIAALKIPYLLPSMPKDFTNDPRFYDCWSKLAPFGLTNFTRVVQLDSDMLVVKNMDELMTLELDDASLGGTGPRAFAASHACVCNPLSKPHYPKDWIPSNCAFTSQHTKPDEAQHTGAGPLSGLSMPNGGLQVVNPSQSTYDLILSTMRDETKTSSYEFSDQSLLGDVFHGRWVALPYIYNALKTLRWDGVHSDIWRDDQVKNVHYIINPKPWDPEDTWPEKDGEVFSWWKTNNVERLEKERERGIKDGF